MSVSCEPNDLMQAAKCFSCIPKGSQEEVMVYLLAQIAGGSTDPATLMQEAKCFKCIPKGELEEVMTYLLCQVSLNTGMLSGAGSPVDLGIKPSFIGQLYEDTSWGIYWRSTGTTSSSWVVIGPSIISVPDVNDIAAGMRLTSPSATSAAVVTLILVANRIMGAVQCLSGWTNLVTLAAPYLTTIDATFTWNSAAKLQNVHLPVFLPRNAASFSMTNATLTAASVNHILARFVASAGYVTGTISLSGGTSSPPTGQGIIDKATLIGRGCTVTTN